MNIADLALGEMVAVTLNTVVPFDEPADVVYGDVFSTDPVFILNGRYGRQTIPAYKIASVELHECNWGPINRAHLTGNPHRRCPVCDFVTLDLYDDEEDE